MKINIDLKQVALATAVDANGVPYKIRSKDPAYRASGVGIYLGPAKNNMRIFRADVEVMYSGQQRSNVLYIVDPKNQIVASLTPPARMLTTQRNEVLQKAIQYAKTATVFGSDPTHLERDWHNHSPGNFLITEVKREVSLDKAHI